MKLTSEERERLLDARKRGKCGRASKEDHDFCTEAYERDPEAYAEVEEQLLHWLKTAPWYELL